MRKLFVCVLGFMLSLSASSQVLLSGEKEKSDKDKFTLLAESKKSEFTVDQEFYFNKKFYFTAKTSEVQVNSYFYMNTKTGLTGYDKDLAEQLRSQKGSELFNEMDFMIHIIDDGEFFVYTTRQREHAKISSVTREMLGFLPDFLEDVTEPEFLKDYMERDGNKTNIGDKSQFPSESFQGVNLDEGGHMLAWLSTNTDLNINPENRTMMLSPFGIGYVFFENKTFLATGWESDNYISRLEKIEDINLTFNGKDYTPFQQKIEQKLSETEEKMALSIDKERQQLEEREREARRNVTAAQSRPGNAAQIAQIEVEIVETKKKILEKRKSLESKAIGAGQDITKKQGSLESVKKNIEGMFEDNGFIEIQSLELKKEILEKEKTLLGNSLDTKQRTDTQKEIECLKNIQQTFDRLYAKFTQIDRQYAENPQQILSQKLTFMNLELAPIQANPCGN